MLAGRPPPRLFMSLIGVSRLQSAHVFVATGIAAGTGFRLVMVVGGG